MGVGALVWVWSTGDYATGWEIREWADGGGEGGHLS